MCVNPLLKHPPVSLFMSFIKTFYLFTFGTLDKIFSRGLFMPSPFEEWWKGHIVVPCPLFRPSPSASEMPYAICI